MAKIFSSIFFRAGLTVVSIFSFTPLLIQAADFQISPMLQEVVLTNEEEKRIEVTITNTTDILGTFRVSVLDFGNLDESGGVAFLGTSQNLETKYSLASWMRPEKDSVTLLPGKSEVIPVIIDNRESLSPGGHYGALVFESVENRGDEAPNTIAINQIIASLVFVKKTGGVKQALDLMDVEYAQNLFSFPQETMLRFHNPGNTHVVPRGRVELTDPFGRLVYRGIINEASALVLPESFRFFPTPLFSLQSAWVPGNYMLTVQYRFEEEGTFRVWQQSLFIFPLFTSSVLLVIGSITGGLLFWRRRKNQIVREKV